MNSLTEGIPKHKSMWFTCLPGQCSLAFLDKHGFLNWKIGLKNLGFQNGESSPTFYQSFESEFNLPGPGNEWRDEACVWPAIDWWVKNVTFGIVWLDWLGKKGQASSFHLNPTQPARLLLCLFPIFVLLWNHRYLFTSMSLFSTATGSEIRQHDGKHFVFPFPPSSTCSGKQPQAS